MRAFLRTGLAIGSLTFATSAAFDAHAEPPKPAPPIAARAIETNEERAARLFRDAERAFDANDLPTACRSFGDSLKLAPKLGTLLNLALCHETQGKVATAWNEFHLGAAWAAQNGQRERQEFAHKHALALEQKLPRVMLQLPLGRDVTTIEVDGEPLPEPEWYLPLYLDPGDHVVAVGAPGKKRRTTPIRVLPWPNTQNVTLAPLDDLEEVAKPAPRPPPQHADSGAHTRRAAAVGIGALGAVTLVVGGVFCVRALGNDDGGAAVGVVGLGSGALFTGLAAWLWITADAIDARGATSGALPLGFRF